MSEKELEGHGTPEEEAELAKELAGNPLADLAKAKLSRAFIVRRELKKLPSLLGEREEVLNLARGEYDGKEGLIALTNRRVVFLEEGIIRHHLEDFPYDKISSVKTETGFRSGKITIFASGNKAHLRDIHPKQRAPEIGDYVRARISGGTPPPTTHPSPESEVAAPSGDVMDQLRKLGELRDAGILTSDEFDAKKAELLARL